jgi:AraC-like DNA-binding protein
VLGYADQAHFVRDFSRVTAMTPGRFAAHHRATAARERVAVGSRDQDDAGTAENGRTGRTG